MGIERCVAWICGLEHVRETIAFPRMLYRRRPVTATCASTSPSLARRSIWARAAAASTWVPPPCGWPNSKASRGPRLRRRPISATFPSAQRGSGGRGPARRQVPSADRRNLRALGEMVAQALARRQDRHWFWAAIIPSRSARSPACRVTSIERGEKIGLIWIDAHADMNTPEIESQRQRAWNAAGVLHRHGAGGADRTSSASRPKWTRERGAGRNSLGAICSSAEPCATPACVLSRCAISMSGACGR